MYDYIPNKCPTNLFVKVSGMNINIFGLTCCAYKVSGFNNLKEWFVYLGFAKKLDVPIHRQWEPEKKSKTKRLHLKQL